MNKMFAPNSCFHVSSLVKYHWKRCNQCMKLLSSQARENSSSSDGPWSVYSQKVSSGVLSKDEHQENVVKNLQRVYDEVVAFERPVLHSQSAGSLFSFFRKPEPQKIIAPNGLYIFGSVGGGKTMLMDLFYETVPVVLCSLFYCILFQNTVNVYFIFHSFYSQNFIKQALFTLSRKILHICFQIKEKLRVHFNSFMLNIHARIHELKIKSGKGASSFRDEGSKPFDPIPPVAADITQESWLICFDEFQVSHYGVSCLFMYS